MDYQDVLAKVGAGSAHPGGVFITEEWMRRISPKPQHRVLEVGCGTGRTLTKLVQQYECSAVGVDIRPAMIDHARRRSRDSGVEIDWRVAAAEELPIETSSVDFVIVESVNVFVSDLPMALAEYRRVLKPSGRLIDVEMFLRAPVDPTWKVRAKRVYGVERVPDQRRWREAYLKAGFARVDVLSSRPVEPGQLAAAGDDTEDMAGPQVYQDQDVIRTLSENARWMEQNYHVLGYAVFSCLASESSDI